MAGLIALGIWCSAPRGTADAHTVPPEAIVGRLSSDAARHAAGVESVVRDPRLPRLLLVRVGPRWEELPLARREALARSWWTAWRHAVPQGVVAVLDAATDRSVVTFARDGAARVAGPAPPMR